MARPCDGGLDRSEPTSNDFTVLDAAKHCVIELLGQNIESPRLRSGRDNAKNELERQVLPMFSMRPLLSIICLIVFCGEYVLAFQHSISDVPENTPVAKLQFFNGIGCDPGVISIWFRPNVTPVMKEQFRKGFGLKATDIEHAYAGAGRGEMFGETMVVSDGYIVPIGTEEFWVDLLKEHPFVQKIGFVLYLTASVSHFAVRDLNHHDAFQTASSRYVSDGKLRELITSFLKQKYESKKATFQILEADDNFLKIRVSGLRGEIVQQSKLWERIELLNAVFFVVNDRLKMSLVVDGSYAETLGNRLPKDDAFSTMEPKYYKDLLNYVQALTTDILTDLHSKGVIRD